MRADLAAPSPTPDELRRELRAIDWRRPEAFAGRNWPFPIEQAIARLQAAAAHPHGHLYRSIFEGAPVAGGSRERAKRSDGARNALTLLCTLVASCDLRGGFVARPRGEPGAQRWERRSWVDLDGLAFGAEIQGARSLRRTERAARELIAQGFVHSVEWRVHAAGEVRSLPGIKVVQERLWRVLGVWAAVRQHRRQLERDRAKAKLIDLQKLMERDRRPRAAAGPVAVGQVLPAANAGTHTIADTARAGPEPPSRQGPTEAAAAEIAKLKRLLGD